MSNKNSRLSAVEADRCQVSMTSFRLPACATWERGEGPGTLIWTWAKRGGHGPRGEDLGGAWQRAEHYQHARKDEPFNLHNSSSGPSTCTWRELETGPYNTAESWWGPHDWSVLSPTAVHRDKRTTSWLACWTLHWGPTWDWERWHVRGGSTPNGQPKVNGGHATGACWAPRAVHRDRRLHCACYFNRGPTWTASRPPTRQSHSGFGVAVLNCVQEFKNRPFWIASSGLKRAACHMLAALSALQQRPHVPLFEKLCFCSIYIWLILKYSCKLQSVRQRAWSASTCTYVWLFSQDFLKGSSARRRQRCRNVAWLHLVGGGILSSFPPTPRLGRVRMRASFGLRVSRCWWHAARWPHLVQGGLASPPSIDWVAHARYHAPIQFSILNYNFKSKCQNRISK